MSISGRTISPEVVTMALLSIGLCLIAYAILCGTLGQIIYICFLPFFLILLVTAFKKPIAVFIAIFSFNYFFIFWYRYVEGEGLSVWVDILWILVLIIVIVNSCTYHNRPWHRARNIMVIGGVIWAFYTLTEVINPSAVFDAWVYSRGLIYHTFLISLLTSILIISFKNVRTLLFLLSIFSIIAIIKAMYQKYAGFDAIENAWLQESGSYKTHLLQHTTRYFSFFTDAGNFGSNMGLVSVIYCISAIYIKDKRLKIYYALVAMGGVYALFLSGTRGAMFVPICGFLLFTLINKNIKLMFSSSIICLCIYVFFAHTYIGEGNGMIRRMRTTFRPTQDASFTVRIENQKRLAEYLKYKPFGEGLGLGGVEAAKYAHRITTTIPHDSTYVKLWMETGIVGLILFLSIYLTSLLYGCYIIMFKIRNKELRGVLMAIACGLFGMMVSAYGNAFFLQFPTSAMMVIFLTILLNGKYIDKQIEEQQLLLTNKTIQKI